MDAMGLYFHGTSQLYRHQYSGGTKTLNLKTDIPELAARDARQTLNTQHARVVGKSILVPGVPTKQIGSQFPHPLSSDHTPQAQAIPAWSSAAELAEVPVILPPPENL